MGIVVGGPPVLGGGGIVDTGPGDGVVAVVKE